MGKHRARSRVGGDDIVGVGERSHGSRKGCVQPEGVGIWHEAAGAMEQQRRSHCSKEGKKWGGGQ